MEDQLKELATKQEQAFERFKELNDRLDEVESTHDSEAELKSNMDELHKRLDEIETQGKRLIQSREDEGKTLTPEQKEYEEKFNTYLRKGHDQNLGELEEKALAVERDPDGGYTVSPTMSNTIVETVFETSPVRQVASVQTISTDAYEELVDRNEASASWVGETESRSETSTPELNKLRIPVHELYAKPKATQKLLDDSSINVESWLAGKVSGKFAREENKAFVDGNGQSKPRGFLDYDAGTSWGQIEQINSGNASAVTADGLLDLVYGIKSPYRANGTVVMNRTTQRDVRKLKDSNNQYLWAPGLANGQPSTLLGYPIADFEDMPDIAADALAIAFGDFREGYQIVDRVGIRTLRDPYSSKPYVEFYTTKRVGGGVRNFEAIKIQKIAA